MGIIKGIFKVGASAILTVTGTASTILKGMSDTVGLEIGSEIFGATKDASFNGIKSMWNLEDSADEEYESESVKLKAQALRCKEMAQKATSEDMRQQLMSRYEELMEQANSIGKE